MTGAELWAFNSPMSYFTVSTSCAKLSTPGTAVSPARWEPKKEIFFSTSWRNHSNHLNLVKPKKKWAGLMILRRNELNVNHCKWNLFDKKKVYLCMITESLMLHDIQYGHTRVLCTVLSELLNLVGDLLFEVAHPIRHLLHHLAISFRGLVRSQRWASPCHCNMSIPLPSGCLPFTCFTTAQFRKNTSLLGNWGNGWIDRWWTKTCKQKRSWPK